MPLNRGGMRGRNHRKSAATTRRCRVWMGVVVTAFIALAAGSTGCRPSESDRGSTPGTGIAVPSSNATALVAPPLAERYAGSSTCRDCHPGAFANWSNSHHALAERKVEPALDRPAAEPVRTMIHGATTSSVHWTAAGLEVVTRGRSGTNEAFHPDLALGVSPLRQYLIPAPGGRWQSTELAYDPRSNDWFNVYGNEDRQPGEWGHWTGRGMTWNAQCAACHNTGLQKGYDPVTDRYHTVMSERGVGCEACHGPQSAHVDWQRARPQPALGDPNVRRMDRAAAHAVCGSCHARRAELTGAFVAGDSFADHYSLTVPDFSDVYYPDGQVRDENYEYGAFLGSRMFHAGVRCVDCHDPHLARPRAADNSLCMRCHGPPVAPAPRIEPASHSHHKPGTPGGQCVDCHMPTTTYMQRHVRHDHGFTIPDPLLTREHGVPNACNSCHVDRDTAWTLAAVERWYGKRMERPTRTRARVVARARAGDATVVTNLVALVAVETNAYWRAALTGLLRQWAANPFVAQVLLARAGDRDPLVRAHALRGLEPLAIGGDPAARSVSENLLNDPVRLVRIDAAWTLRHVVSTNAGAGRDLRNYLVHNLDQPLGALQYADWLADRGEEKASLGWYEKAVIWDPNSAPIRQSLAVAYSRAGRITDAIRELNYAIQLMPQDAGARLRLALALNEAGDLPATVAALEMAVKLDPQLAQAWYNLGLAYSSLDRPADALSALGEAERLEPASARMPYARATILAQLGRREDAVRAAKRALELEPGNVDARRLIQQLGR